MFFWLMFFVVSLCGVSARSVPSGYVERTVTRADGRNATAYLREDFVPTTEHQFVRVEARGLGKRFVSDFRRTQDHQYMCAFESDYCNSDFGSPESQDCEVLMDVLLGAPGYWRLGDWAEGAFEPLAFLETCIVTVARTDDHFREEARVGDGDVYAWLSRTTQRCKNNYDGTDHAGSVGTYTCPGENGGVPARIIAWITAKIH